MIKQDYIYGISYGAAIQSEKKLREVQTEQMGLIELPFGEYENHSEVRQYIKKKELQFGIHVPSQYFIEKLPFYNDMRTKEDVKKLVDFIDEHLSMGTFAKYLLVHLPLHSKLTDAEKIIELNVYYVTLLKNITMKYGLLLLLENVAASKYFYESELYLELLDENTKICFDIGHAHTIQYWIKEADKKDYVMEYFHAFRDHIVGVHLYNTTCREGEYQPHMHYPFLPIFKATDGFMNYDDIVKELRQLKNLTYIIYEPHKELYEQYHSLGNIVLGGRHEDF